MAQKSFNTNRYLANQSVALNFNDYVFGGSEFDGTAVGTVIYAGNPNSCS